MQRHVKISRGLEQRRLGIWKNSLQERHADVAGWDEGGASGGVSQEGGASGGMVTKGMEINGDRKRGVGGTSPAGPCLPLTLVKLVLLHDAVLQL